MIDKVVMIGNRGVGKTSLMNRCVLDRFVVYVSSMSVDCLEKSMEIDGVRVRMRIWIPGGAERFKFMNMNYYRGAEGVVFVYDLCDRKSFEDIEKVWNREYDKKR